MNKPPLAAEIDRLRERVTELEHENVILTALIKDWLHIYINNEPGSHLIRRTRKALERMEG